MKKNLIPNGSNISLYSVLVLLGNCQICHPAQHCNLKSTKKNVGSSIRNDFPITMMTYIRFGSPSLPAAAAFLDTLITGCKFISVHTFSTRPKYISRIKTIFHLDSSSFRFFFRTNSDTTCQHSRQSTSCSGYFIQHGGGTLESWLKYI